MTLGRAGTWVVIIAGCIGVFSSGAGVAVTIGNRGARLDAVEQKVKDYGSDHDKIITMEANIAWIVRALGGEPK